ncbi:MAG: hypothetical protein M3317_13410 [Actinomycetota bacterium]|nr:hypothetical protein [Actinomycetota bacterium]
MERRRAVGGISTRTAAWLAWSLWALTVTLTALSLLLLVLNLSYPNTHIFEWWLGNALVVIDVTVGAIVASHRPENPVGWLLCLSGVVISTDSFVAQYATYALVAQPNSLPAGEAMAWIASWLLPIMIGLQVFYLLLFTTGRLPSRRWRWLAWLTVTFVVVEVILSAFSSGALMGALGPIRNPLGIEGFNNFYLAPLYTISPLLFGAVALSVFMRLRHAVGVERQQIKWLAYAAAAWALGIIFNVITLALDTPLWFERAALAYFTVAGEAVPIAIGIAIMRYRLYDIDILINRTLVYGSLTATLVALYFSGIVVLQRVFVSLTGQQSTLAVVASTLLIAALFAPLRRRIQSFIDRRFYRRKYDAQKTLEAFSVKLRDETDLEALNEDLVGVVSETMQPTHVSLWLRPHLEVGRRRKPPG